ncbi:MAG: hypothetical protein ACHQM6_11110 [Candidatus Kapaibacterium sp.]
MKIIFILFLAFPSGLFAQRISVDSLESNGYHVRIYKPPKKPEIRTITKYEHDTIYVPVEHILILRDTILREKVYYFMTEKSVPERKQETNDDQQLHTLLIGNANTNGYGMHLGVMLAMGKRISFFIGGGMGYNSVTKITHLDLAGQIMIKLE